MDVRISEVESGVDKESSTTKEIIDEFDELSN